MMIPNQVMAKGIFEHQDTMVPENQIVDEVIVIGGDATIAGIVSDAVIVFNGDVDLTSTAKVNGIVLVIGGKLRQEQGAVISDDVIHFSLDTATKNSLLIGGGLVVGTWLAQLATSILFILLSVLIVFVSKGRILALVDRVRRAPGSLLSIGFFSSLILIALSVVLLVTVIGIPLAVLIFMIMGLAFMYGTAILSMVIGATIQVTRGRPDWVVALAGSIVLVSFLNIPLLGVVLILGIAVFSVGVMTLWALERWRRK